MENQLKKTGGGDANSTRTIMALITVFQRGITQAVFAE
jgi:hypothetical protein